MIANKDIPIGFQLPGVKKRMIIELMGSWPMARRNPIHWSPELAKKEGWPAPIALGMGNSCALAEMLVHFFGKSFFTGGAMACKYTRPTFAGDIIETHGIVREKTPEGSGVRIKVEIWADKQDGTVVAAGTAEATVE